MANTFLTPDVIAETALATLYENTVMLPLVYTDHSTEFTGAQKVGDTVNIRKPAVFTANEFNRANGITVQEATEGSIPVKLDKIADVSFAVTSEDLALHIDDFDEQLLAPATEALSQHIDRALIALKADLTQVAGVTPAGRSWDKPEVLIEAGRLLDLKNVPNGLRRAVVGATTRAAWLDSDLLKRADTSGTTEALRQGSIGRNLFGFDAYMTQNVVSPAANPATGQPTTEVGLAFHPTAFSFVSAPLPVPPNASASVQSYKGLSIRVAQQYDIKLKQTIVSLDVLYGVKTIDKDRAVLLKGADKA
ncbi:major capsid protein [Gordonia phage ObLaDi]|uniref:Major capsid protein n=3 Tax=Cafassovirus TaxID=3425056 RepID=A0A9E7QES3_9CAUD|nr:major capsid protein [Gordonia phage Cafasso]UVK59747.1 major capsid protein [Gordonia phage Aleemily]UXE03730.1 major capsid protein [Gordonia phage ObLaDi]